MRLKRRAVFLIAALLVSTAVSAQNDIIVRAYRTVNVRRGPSTQYDIIGQLNSGDEVRVIGRSDRENDWLQIEYNKGIGWVAYFTVTVLSSVDNLPIVDAPELRTVTAVPASSLENSRQAATDLYVTTFRRVNVRIGPGLGYARLRTLDPGSTADITGRTPDNQWLRIIFQGQRGWVAYFVITVTGSLDSAPIVDIPIRNQVTPEPTTPPQIVMRYNVNLRSEPALDSQIVTVIPFGTALTPEARVDDQWLRVTYDGQTGWLMTSLVSVTGNLESLPPDSPS